jgi:hypothetical protein
MHGLSASVRAILGPIVPLVLLVVQCPIGTADNEIYAPAVAAVAAVGSASGNIRLAPKADATPAAVS